MKKRLHDKKAGVAILIALIVISLAEVVLRGVILKESMLKLTNAGEPLVTALLSLTLIIFANKGKDRLFYILCGSWVGYFVFDQLFGLPEMIATFFAAMKSPEGFTEFAILIHAFSMVSIVAIGGLLAKYVTNGTIDNKAYNILCIATILMLAVNVVFAVYDIVVLNDIDSVLAILNNVSRGAMVFLLAFFAYDSAKFELKKSKLAK